MGRRSSSWTAWLGLAWLVYAVALLGLLSRDGRLTAVFAALAAGGAVVLVAGALGYRARLRRPAVSRRARPPTERPDETTATGSSAAAESPVAWPTDRLWMGFVREGLQGLERLTVDPTVLASVRANSFLQLARWDLAQGDAEQAHELAVLSRVASGNMRPQREQPALEIDALISLGRVEEARELVRRLLADAPEQPDLLLRLANTYWTPAPEERDDAERLRLLNEVYSRAGLSPVAPTATSEPLALDNLSGRGDAPAAAEQSTVSVIVPAHNAARTVPTAIRSLLQQSWQPLEVIVVDDASDDDTAPVVAAMAADDDRVRLLRQQTNRGTYAARNLGLGHAHGDFVTVHDADDWSHPQKLEHQVIPLLEDQRLAASISSWVRADDDLRFWWAWRPATRLVHRNYSSLLVRREVFDQVGRWDEVRVLADVEFFERLVAWAGDQAVRACVPQVPLAFGRRAAGSLTQANGLAAPSRLEATGARWLYQQGFAWWHDTAGFRSALPYRPPDDPRPFPAPHLLRHGADTPPLEVDLVVFDDFRDEDALTRLAIDELREAVHGGLTCRLLHVPAIDGDAKAPLHPRLLQAVVATGTGFIAAGETVSCELTVVARPDLFDHLPARLPKVTSARLAVLVGQADLLAAGEPADSTATLRRWQLTLTDRLGSTPHWQPTDGDARRTLEAADPSPSNSLRILYGEETTAVGLRALWS